MTASTQPVPFIRPETRGVGGWLNRGGGPPVAITTVNLPLNSFFFFFVKILTLFSSQTRENYVKLAGCKNQYLGSSFFFVMILILELKFLLNSEEFHLMFSCVD